MKLCKDCMHCETQSPQRDPGLWYCMAPEIRQITTSLVTGELKDKPGFCESARDWGKCGPDAKLFVAKLSRAA